MASSAQYPVNVDIRTNVDKYKTGLKQAEKYTKKFSKNVKKSSAAAKGAFQGMASSLPLLNSSFGRIVFAIQGVGRGFKTIIPLVKTLKVALISSGIGAIIVGIGVALVAVQKYIHGSAEGTLEWRKKTAGVKQALSTVNDTVIDVGKNIFKVLIGQKSVKEAWQDTKEIVKGTGEEIKKDSKKAVALQERENKLTLDKIKFTVQEQKLQTQIAKLIKTGNDLDRSSADRVKDINKAETLTKQLYGEKTRLAKEEYEVKVGMNALGHNSLEDDQEEANLQVAYLSAQEAQAKQEKKIQAQRFTNLKLKSNEEIAQQKINDAIRKEINLDLQKHANYELLGNDLEELNSEAENFQLPVPDIEPYRNVLGFFAKTKEEMVILGGTLAQSFSQGADSFKAYGSIIKKTTEDIILAQTAQALTGAINTAIGSAAATGPFGLIVLPALIGLAIGAVKTALAQIPGLAQGGVVPPGYPNDTYLARLSSGENIIPAGQNQNLTLDPVVISGDKLALIQSNSRRKRFNTFG